ncbi:MAG: hypothetical protein R8K22_05700, partial [Mariprofundaceae bacterium]
MYHLLILIMTFMTVIPTVHAASSRIELTQTACQFIESEGKDHAFVSDQSADCLAINDKTGAARLKSSKVLELTAGDYVFRVHNKN